MSSSGEMKMSLRLMTCHPLGPHSQISPSRAAHILVSEVLEKLQFAVCALGENRGAERFHDLLDGDGLVGELILRRAAIQSVGGLLLLLL